jgi:voltage-gated sodium channel
MMMPRASVQAVNKAAKRSVRKSRVSRKSERPIVGKSVFPNAEAMKDQVRENCLRKEYRVAQLYKAEGWCQRVARSHLFENMTLVIIGLNALWISVETDFNNADTLHEAPVYVQVCEHLFCVYFAAEILIRFGAFKKKTDCFRDAWFTFDFLLVFVMVIETWVLAVLLIFVLQSGGLSDFADVSVLRTFRILRLTRMARMVRLLRAMPELMILIRGMVAATRSVFFTLFLLFTIVYVFAIAFRQLLKGTGNDDLFGSVPATFFTLLNEGTLPDFSPIVRLVGDVNPALAVLMLIFILLSTLTVMNMLVGVLVEVVSCVSTCEKERMNITYVKLQIEQLLEIDEDGGESGHGQLITKEEFDKLILSPQATRIIQDIGVDILGLIDFAENSMFKDKTELTFSEFMELVLSLRGTNMATVQDVVFLRLFMTMKIDHLESLQQFQSNICQQLQQKLDTVLAKIVKK